MRQRRGSRAESFGRGSRRGEWVRREIHDALVEEGAQHVAGGAVRGLGGRDGIFRQAGIGIGEREGDAAEAAKEGAEVATGTEVGDGIGWVGAEEAVQDVEDFAGDFRGRQPGGALPEGAPAGEGGEAGAFGQGRGTVGGGFGGVVAAEGLIAQGGAAAFLTGGKNVAAFEGWHHGKILLAAKEKAVPEDGLLCFCSLFLEYQSWRVLLPTLLVPVAFGINN